MRVAFAVSFAVLLAAAIPALALEIHDAAAVGDLARVETLAAGDPEIGAALDEANNTPLHLAAINGHGGVVEYLLDIGVAVDVGDNENSTALDVASQQGHLDVVRLLIARGADPEHGDVSGMTPLHFACYEGRAEVATVLVKHGADVRATTANGSTPLHGATWGGHAELVALLTDAGADVHARNAALYTPLLSAAAGQAGVEIVELLIARGADIHDRNTQGETALMMAARAGKAALSSFLLESGVPIDAMTNGAGRAAIHTAAEGGQAEIVQLLLDAGADVNQASDGGWTPLAWAGIRGHLEVGRFLVDSGADVNVTDDRGVSPLHHAFNEGNVEFAELLLDAGADVDAAEVKRGRTLLHGAALRGNTAFAELALAHGAALDVRDDYDMTPLHYAGKYGHKDVAELLAALGAVAPGMEENYGRCPLLDRTLESGEAAMWYLGHCGWALKTKEHFLVFDYWNNGEDPASPCLANGHIDPEEIEDLDVYVFVTHEHGDHYDPTIFTWDEGIDNLTYVYGFRPETLFANRETGYEGPAYEYVGPREHTTIDGMDIRTIAANDAGVGFVVEVDGLVLYHAGDHAGWEEGEKDGFTSEIDYLDQYVDRLDLAFVNVTGCHAHGPEPLKDGNVYTIEKLEPSVVIPTHAANREYVYEEIAGEYADEGVGTIIRYPVNRGDSFVYRGGDAQQL